MSLPTRREFSVVPFKRRFGAPPPPPAPHNAVPYAKPTLITTYNLTEDRRILVPGKPPLFRQFPPRDSDLMEGYPERYYPKFEVKGIDSIIAVLRTMFHIAPQNAGAEQLSSPAVAVVADHDDNDDNNNNNNNHDGHVGATAGETVNQQRKRLPLPKKVDFVSFRNNFNKIMGTPYASPRDQWMIELHRVDGTVFMSTRRTKDELVHFEKEHIVHREQMKIWRMRNGVPDPPLPPLHSGGHETEQSKENEMQGSQQITQDVAIDMQQSVKVGDGGASRRKRPRAEMSTVDGNSFLANERETKRARKVTHVRLVHDNEHDSAMSPEEYDRYFQKQQEELVANIEDRTISEAEARQIKFMYQGYRCETLCSEQPENFATALVNPNEEFCGMFVCKLGGHCLILCAELDCLDENRILPGNDRLPPSSSKTSPSAFGPGHVNQDLFVEVKTNRLISNERSKISFEKYKLFKSYIQSFLVATPKIMFCYRDESGRVKGSQVFDTLHIPRLARAHWEPWSCLQFTDALLTFIANNTEDDKKYLVRFGGGDTVVMEETEEVNFMPQDFVDEWKRRPKQR